MKIVEVDIVHPEAFERPLEMLAHVFSGAVDEAVGLEGQAELRRKEYLVALAGALEPVAHLSHEL